MHMLKTHWKPIVFMVWLFAMAGVYDLIWQARPDYFRVTQNVNFLPIDLVQIARSYSDFAGDRPLPDYLNPDDQSAILKIRSLYDQAQKLTTKLDEQQKALAEGTENDGRDAQIYDKSLGIQMEAYVQHAIVDDQAKVAGFDAQLQSILDQARVKSVDDLSAQQAVNYTQLAVKRQEASVDLAKATVAARNYVIEHPADFTHAPEQEAIRARHRQNDDLRADIDKSDSELLNLRGELYDAFIEYQHKAHLALSYWDFLYFSVGAATTATFADLAPNHTSVRLLVCLQVLVSVVFVGVMVYERWSHFLTQPAKVDSPMQRTNHHEDATTVFG
jgi:hypothetical protein